MECSRPYTIALRDVPADGATFAWHLGDDFFKDLDQTEIEHGSLDCTLRVRHKADAYELHITMTGSVEIPCNRCLEPMEQGIDAETTLNVKPGSCFEDDGDVIMVPADTLEFDIAWNLYEVIVLGIPIQHAHADGQCPVDVPFLVDDLGDEESDTETGSPFAKLKELMGQGRGDKEKS